MASGNPLEQSVGASHANLKDGMIVSTYIVRTTDCSTTTNKMMRFLKKLKFLNQMNFHGGIDEIILFEFWTTDNITSKQALAYIYRLFHFYFIAHFNNLVLRFN